MTSSPFHCLSILISCFILLQIIIPTNSIPINVDSLTKIKKAGPPITVANEQQKEQKQIEETPIEPPIIKPNQSPAQSFHEADCIRVAYQGEPGAYSECATRELLGDNVIAIGRQDFEACYKAVVDMEVDYACLPIENSLGGSIHENYDLMLKYDLTIVAEHELRVSHCMLVRPGVKQEDIKYAISHPQALAQCDNYLRGLGIKPVKAYDTSGSAKMLSKDDFEKQFSDREGAAGKNIPMTHKNTCAIASVLAGKTYGLDALAKGIEDDDSNFTRFLLLGRKGIKQHLTKNIPAKTSVVFTLPNDPGALYKALACFSLRDIDFSKIESRPMSASLINFLKFKASSNGGQYWSSGTKSGLPRFRFCFYLDILANELDEHSQNALHHLREQADFCRVLGSYPQKSRLVGHVKEAADQMKFLSPAPLSDVSLTSLPSDTTKQKKLNIGIIGFGTFGQFLAKKILKSTQHSVSCIDPLDKSKEAEELNVDYHPMFNMLSFLDDLDVIVLSIPLIDFANIVHHLPHDRLRKKLVVEVCALNSHPKNVLLSSLPLDVDIISSNPMFGPKSCTYGSDDDGGQWDNLPFIYEKVRTLDDPARAQAFLDIFSRARCKMVEMTAEQHDTYAANAEFVTFLTGRMLNSKSLLPPTPIVSKEYALLKEVAQMTDMDSFDSFYGMFKFNEENAKIQIREMRERLSKIEMQLVAKEAYLAAKTEMLDDERQRLFAECKMLLREVAKGSTGNANGPLIDPAPSISNTIDEVLQIEAATKNESKQ